MRECLMYLVTSDNVIYPIYLVLYVKTDTYSIISTAAFYIKYRKISLKFVIPHSRMIHIHASIVLHKSELPSPHELHKGVHPHTHTLTH